MFEFNFPGPIKLFNKVLLPIPYYAEGKVINIQCRYMNMLEFYQRRVDRLRLLYSVYTVSLVNGVNTDTLASNVGLTNDKYKEALGYLIGEGLLNKDGTGRLHSITHAGIKLIETCILNPDQRSELFPSLNEIK